MRLSFLKVRKWTAGGAFRIVHFSVGAAGVPDIRRTAGDAFWIVHFSVGAAGVPDVRRFRLQGTTSIWDRLPFHDAWIKGNEVQRNS